MESKKTAINLISAGVAFSTSVAINFFLTPFIVRHVGVEAYGFVAMSNDLLAYISVLTMALNSMSARFIAIAMHKNELEEAREYYASTIGANIILSICIFSIFLPGIICLEQIINIPNSLIIDVKCLFLFSLVNFFLVLIFSSYGTGYIICNKLYLSSVVQIKGSLLRLGVLAGLFTFCVPHVAYMGIGALAGSIWNKVYDFYYQHKLVPELRFSLSACRWQRCRILLASGVWSSITRLGNILAGNLDLLIVNLFLSSTEMGILAVVKIVPTFLTTVTGMMAGVYMPEFLELYAKEKFDEMVESINRAMKVFSLVLSMPLVVFLSSGDVFFRLWMPGQDAEYMYILSVLSLMAIVVIGPVAMLHNIFTVVNKLKTNSLLVVFTGFLNTVAGLVVLKYTDWGLYGIVFITAALSLLRNLFYTVPYGAIYLGKPVHTFFPVLLRTFLCVAGLSFVMRIMLNFALPDSWGSFALAVLLMIFLNIAVQLMMVFSGAERKIFIKKVKNLLGKYIMK